MAVRAQIVVPVDKSFTTALNKFMADVQRFQIQAQFQQFSVQLSQVQTQQQRQGAFRRILIDMNRVSKLFEKMTRNLERITDRLINNTMGVLGKAFMRLITATIPFLEFLIPVVGWAVTGVTFAWWAIKGAWRLGKWIWDKLVGLGDAILQDYVTAKGAGTTIGGLRAFRVAFGDLPINEEMFRTAARGRMDATSMAYRTLKVLGLEGNTVDSAELLAQMMRKSRAFLLSTPPTLRLPQARAIGLTEWFSTELITTLPQITEPDLERKIDNFRRYRRVLELTPKAVEGWKSFSVLVRKAGQNIISIIGEALADPKTGLLDAIQRFVPVVQQFVAAMLKSRLSEHAISTIKGWIEGLAKYLKSGKLMEDLRAVKRELTPIVNSLEILSNAIQGLSDFIGGSASKLESIKAEKEVEKGAPFTVIDSRGRITQVYRPGERGVRPRPEPGFGTGRRVPGREPRTRQPTGQEPTGPTPETPTAPGDYPPGTYNYFQRQGKVPSQVAGDIQKIQTPYGPASVHKEAAADFMGFYRDLKAAGAPIHSLGSYNVRPMRWSNRWSSHAMGTATDIDDARYLSPEMTKWIREHPQQWEAIKQKWNIGQPLPQKDAPHLEWRGPHGSYFDENGNPVAGTARPGTTSSRAGAPPSSRRTGPAVPAPTPEPEVPPILQPQRRPPGYVPAVPPSGRRVTPTPRARPGVVAPTPTPRARPGAVAPTPTPGGRTAPPSGRRTGPPAPAPAAPPTTPDLLDPSAPGAPRGGANRGVDLYQRLLTEFRAHPPSAAPSDGARFGIVNNTPEEWARFGVAVANEESGFDPRSTRVTRTERSYGVFQYDHSQVDTGNAYDVDASVRTFVRDANDAADRGEIGDGRTGSRLARRFATIGNHPNRAIRSLPLARQVEQRAGTVPTTPRRPQVWGGTELQKLVRPGAPGTPSGPAPVRPPPPPPLPQNVTPETRQPAPSATAQTGVTPTTPTTPSPTGPSPWSDLKKAPEARRYSMTNVDPRLREVISAGRDQFEARHPGYTIEGWSGRRDVGQGAGPHWSKPGAIDMVIRGPDGKIISNEGPDPTGLYHEYARDVYGELLARHPELKDQYRWGGAFGTVSGGNIPDLMHHDLQGEVSPAGHIVQNRIQNLGPNPNVQYGKPVVSQVKPSVAQLAADPNLAPPEVRGEAETMAGQSVPIAQTAPSKVPGGGGVSDALVSWVAKKENFSSTAFSDYGQTNIGYGTSANGRTTITEPEARDEMRGELERHITEINNLNPNLPQGAKDALASLSFNTGGSWYRKPDTNPDGTLTLKGLVKAGDIEGMRQRFLQYDKAGGKSLKGLTTRREQESHMFTDPNYIGSGQGTTAAQDWGGKDYTPSKEEKLPPTEATPSGARQEVADLIKRIDAKKSGEEDIKPGEAAEYLKKHFEESEKKVKEPGLADPATDKVNLAPAAYPKEEAAKYGEVSSAYPYLTDPLRIKSQQWEQFIKESPSSKNIEWRGETKPTDIPSMNDFEREVTTNEQYWKGAEKPVQPSFGVDWQSSISRSLEQLPSHTARREFDPTLGPGGATNVARPIPVDEGMDESGGAAAFLRNQFKQLSTQREAGARSTAGMIREARIGTEQDPYEPDPSKRTAQQAPGREDPYAPFEAKESTVYYTGPKGKEEVTYTDPESGQSYTDRTKPIGPPASGLPDYIPGIATNYLRTPQRGRETLGGYVLVTPKGGPNAGQSYIFLHSDAGPGVKGGAEKLDYNAPASMIAYGPKNWKDPPGGTYSQFIGNTLPPYVEPNRALLPGEEKQFNLSKQHQDFIEGMRKIREHPGGIGSDAIAQAKADRQVKTDREDQQQTQTEDKDVPSKDIRSKDPDIQQPKISESSPGKRTRMPQRMKINKPQDSQFDVHKERDTESHAEHNPSPSKEDDSDSTVDTGARGGGGSSGEELNL